MNTRISQSLKAGGETAKRLVENAPIVDVPVSKIVPYPRQSRKIFDEAALKLLSESIEAIGLRTEIWVRGNSKQGFELIAGERRLRAVQLLGRDKIRAKIIEADDELAHVLHLTENGHREQLTNVEQALAIAAEVDRLKGSLGAVCAAYSMSKGQVSKLVAIAKDAQIAEGMILSGITGINNLYKAVQIGKRDPKLREKLEKLLNETSGEVTEENKKRVTKFVKDAGNEGEEADGEESTSPKDVERKQLVVYVNCNPHSKDAGRFAESEKQWGKPRLSHQKQNNRTEQAIVQFGDQNHSAIFSALDLQVREVYLVS
jgi:ParB/RepB/Spo0J family partition protein